jgi:hypothetical protein
MEVLELSYYAMERCSFRQIVGTPHARSIVELRKRIGEPHKKFLPM